MRCWETAINYKDDCRETKYIASIVLVLYLKQFAQLLMPDCHPIWPPSLWTGHSFYTQFFFNILHNTSDQTKGDVGWLGGHLPCGPVTPVLPQLTAPFPLSWRQRKQFRVSANFQEKLKKLKKLLLRCEFHGTRVMGGRCWKQRTFSGALEGRDQDHPCSPPQVAISCYYPPQLHFGPGGGRNRSRVQIRNMRISFKTKC